MTLRDILKKEPDGLVGRAYAFSERAHRAQTRKTGEPYFNHARATADTLVAWRLDDATVAAGLLHDTVEDTGVSLEAIRKEFGGEVAFLVDGVTKLGRVKYRGAENKVENLRKMILALSEDLRVVFIKLADRLHNMQTLSALPPAKQKRIALETDEIYAPLAYRLGMHNLSGELQDLAFPFIHPREYRWLIATTKEQYDERLVYLEKTKPLVEKVLRDHNIKPLGIEIRAKRYASLYKKLLRRDMDIGKIYDLVATRVILDTIPECYAALGVIHEVWPPVPRRIKDYIAMPKPNGYKSLHTTVIGPEGKTIEFQLRTKEMHDEDEYGVAAHWLYDEKRRGEKIVTGGQLAKEITWVQQLKNWQEHLFADGEGARGDEDDDEQDEKRTDRDHEELLNAMKVDFFTDRIFAVTPQGDVIDLPVGATPVDFAYHIHSAIGDSCAGAKVNGALMPLDHKLKSGDIVEILTHKGKKPSEDWLRFVKTSLAREHIRAAVRGNGAKGGAGAISRALRTPTRSELKVVEEEHLKNAPQILDTIRRSHMKILHAHTEDQKGGHYRFNRIEIQSTDRAKIDRLIVKLKQIKGVREVSYRLI